MNALRRPLATPLFLLYLAGVVILALQPVRTMIQPGYEGILYKGGDESQYIMRVEQAMHHPFVDVSNAITSGTKGLQMTFLESAAGTLFGWLGLSGPGLTILLACLFAPLIMPLFTLLALRFGVPRLWAIAGGVVCFWLLLGPLRRVVHQSWSLPLVVLTLLLIVDWWKRPTRLRSVMLGIVLGLMAGVYVWAWTYTWAVFGFVVLLMAVADLRKRRMRSVVERLVQAMIAGLTALVVASPFLFLMRVNAHHPDAAETSIRSALIHAREFESLPRSLALVLFTVLAAFTIGRQPDRRRLLPLFAMILALFAVLHQQFVHGLVLSFWTHYYPYLCVVALLFILVVLSSRHRYRMEVIAMLSASVFLFGAVHDYHSRIAVVTTIPRWSTYQHLAPAIASLNRIQEQQTILSDLDSSLIIGTYTDHDLLYTEFLRHVLLSFPELAERYCLTRFMTGKPADTEWLAYNVQELSGAGQTATLTKVERDKVLTKDACVEVYARPKETLQKFGVTLVLWDEKNYPDWEIPPAIFQETEKGAGWSLWKVR
jgi:hypothetical protein